VKLAISQIAWNAAEEPQIAELMAAHGFTGVEVVPGRMPAPDASDAQVAAARAFWESRGIAIVAMQALLFGHPELTIFGSEETRRRTRDYLCSIIRLGGRLGARALVFGSPRNRARGALPLAQAQTIAVDFFGELGAIAAAAGTCLCLEPNPPQYGADFCVDSIEALALVEKVASPGFGLHLDSACALLAGEELAPRIRASGHVLRHVHVSEPALAPVGPGGTAELGSLGAALRAIDYPGFVSIEMKASPEGNAAPVERALRHVAKGLG
jgi:sugar phosphate isomerase/epimerase